MSVPLAPFQLVQPHSIAEAIARCSEHPGSRFVAGGSDLIVNLRHGLSATERLIDLNRINELKRLEAGPDGLVIGAGVTLAALARHRLIAEIYPAIAEAAQSVAGPGHREMATVGGNLCLDTRCLYYNQSHWWRQANGFCLKYRGDICHVAPTGKRCRAAFCGDLAPAFMVHGAEVEIASPAGRRRLPLAELYRDDGLDHLELAAGELVAAVHVPASDGPSAYAKLRVRGAVDFPLAGVAVAVSRQASARSRLRIALTGTNSRPFLVAGLDTLTGDLTGAAVLEGISKLVQKQTSPMRTTTLSSHYRRLATAALAQRLTRRLAEACKLP
jgi:4-hydroxybenzoyl-CoA reductase subunit beta